MTHDHAPTQPPAAEARRARREMEWARRDAEDAERARLDQRIDEAATAAVEMLPNGVGAAVAALLDAMKPWRASDGHMSSSAIGRSSPEVLALAEALLAPPTDPVEGDLEQAIEALHVALDEHDDSTCNMRSNGVVDGYDHDIVRALLLAGWTPPAKPPPTTAPTAAEVETMARELHTLLRNGKEFPYADGEEKRYYELVVTRWLEKLPDIAEVLAELREEIAALARDMPHRAPGVRAAIALVEAAQRQLGDDERGREHG